MIVVTNKLSIKAIAELIHTTYQNVYYATKIKGTTYERYFTKIPEPTFIEKNKKYYDGKAVERFRQFFKMDKMQKKIFNVFKVIHPGKNIKYV